jgi:nucleoid-associated protein YgaU
VVKRGDTLSRIAADEYDDPREWRRIADANPEATANPLRLEPGTTLVIPPLDLFSGSAGRRP